MIKYLLSCLLVLSNSLAFSQKGAELVILTGEPEISLDSNWKYHYGNSDQWALPSFNDDNWPLFKTDSIEWINDTLWFRKWVKFEDRINEKQLAIKSFLVGKEKIFVDGNEVEEAGKDSSMLWNFLIPVPLNLTTDSAHLIAVRVIRDNKEITNDKNVAKVEFTGHPGPKVSIVEYYKQLKGDVKIVMVVTMFLVFVISTLLVMGGFHLLLFFYYKKEKSNLFLSLFCIGFAGLLISISSFFLDASFNDQPVLKLIKFFFPLLPVFLVGLLNSIFYTRLLKIFWICLIGILIGKILHATGLLSGGAKLSELFAFVAVVEMFREIIVALRKKKEGSRIIGLGILFTLIAVVGLIHYLFTNNNPSELFGIIILLCALSVLLLSIPLTMSFHFASRFSKTNNDLREQIVQVQNLNARTLEQEKEKKKILKDQNQVLEQEVALRTAEVVQQKKILEEKNKDITDSITYAERIQNAILPGEKEIRDLLPESFVLYKPKDIVSGDFYWAGTYEKEICIAVVDCTGHGVPGALMSMIGNTLLNDIVAVKHLTKPGLVLEALHKGVRNILKQNLLDSETRDGMDICFCSINTNEKTLQYSGAMRPLYIIRKGALIEIKPDKKSIGGTQDEEQRTFSNNIYKLEKGDVVYMFSDGYADQFGGDTGKKFMIRNFQELLKKISALPFNEQKRKLEEAHISWKNNYDQVDDILVIGFSV